MHVLQKFRPLTSDLHQVFTVVGDSSRLGRGPLSAKPIGCEMMQS